MIVKYTLCQTSKGGRCLSDSVLNFYGKVKVGGDYSAEICKLFDSFERMTLNCYNGMS